jgi:murein DD-endopeptidase MepM/ murein hydrolase activator NlpD
MPALVLMGILFLAAVPAFTQDRRPAPQQRPTEQLKTAPVEVQRPPIDKLKVVLDVPVTPVPAGYGHYCSIIYPSGGWTFGSLAGADSDPCGDLLKQNPGGTIARAGLWNPSGENNAMVRCASGELFIYRDQGSQPTDNAYNDAQGKKGCVFTVAPTRLPIFGHPWAPTPGHAHSDDDVDSITETGFNYDILGQPWNVSDFGQLQDPSKPATQVDRYGRQQPYTVAADCVKRGKPVNCKINHSFEGAYDWNMPLGKPLIAVADGLVVGAGARDISEFIGPNCYSTDKYQQEVFIEHQVGTGVYAERFVAAYHHMSLIKVHTGDKVTRGQVIAANGTSGCSGGPHLDFSVLRLTNLSGARSYEFATTPHGYGVNGIQGVIDPFGWSAPQGVDPWAWKSLGAQQGYLPVPVKEPGAFSIYLWIPGQAPPSY